MTGGGTDRSLYVSFLIGIAQITSAVLVLVVPGAMNVTAAIAIIKIARFLPVDPHYSIATCYYIAGAMAIAAYSLERLKNKIVLSLLIPQYFLLGLQLISINVAVANGVFPDGYVPKGGGAFIFFDQIWAWLLSFAPVIHLLFAHNGTPRK